MQVTSNNTNASSKLFFEEATEQLSLLDQGLVRLEKEPSNTELIQSLFRAAHTLKGSSATIGFMEITNLTHAMEDVLDGILHNK
jgi:two-component system chemotaxis sensor kinase CheA